MSLVGANGLNSAVKEHRLQNPGKILDDLNNYASESLYKQGDDNAVRDGMDIAICSIDNKKMLLEYSGAYNPLYIVRDNEILITKGDKFAIGSFNPYTKSYTTHKIPILKGDIVYVFSDGYADQFGGNNGKKFMYRQFRETLLSIKDLSMPEQKRVLDQKIENWKGSYEQVDDILVIGVKIDQFFQAMKNRIIHNFPFLIFFQFLIVSVFSQQVEIRFNHLSINDGLSQSTVYSVIQDDDGFMWICTQDGLNKYDGQGFAGY